MRPSSYREPAGRFLPLLPRGGLERPGARLRRRRGALGLALLTVLLASCVEGSSTSSGVVPTVTTSSTSPTTSSEPASVNVPNLIGLTEAEAASELRATGLTASVKVRPNEESKGLVVAQDPAPGTMAAPGTSIHLVVSSGP